jgi:hypothetical protein
MDKNTYQNVLKWAKKIKAINYLGGKCDKCGDDNIFHLVFHHLESSNKEKCINNLKNNRWTIIEKELKKCQLLCNNCHAEVHYKQDFLTASSKDTVLRKINKNFCLDYKNNKCEKCGYDNNEHALVFHHTKDKEFELSCIRYDIDLVEVKKFLKDELDKCLLLCRNCHGEEHMDIIFFEKYKKEIYKKVENYKEIQKKLPVDDIKKLYENGMTQNNIAKYYNASKGTISGIIRNIKMKYNMGNSAIGSQSLSKRE